MDRITVAEAIVKTMKTEEVEKIFIVPGESFLSVTNELYEEPTIEVISGRQEGGVSFIAEGYAKASGNVGVCFATRGPGATNLSSGLHTAYHDSTPLVAFIGQVERPFLGRDAFQEINLSEYFKHIVKWTAEIREPSRTVETVRRAFHEARTGRPGPVLISLPEDVLDEFVEWESQKQVNIFSKPRPNVEAIKMTSDLLMEAENPVIIAGGGIRTDNSVELLVEVSEKIGVPVVSATRRMDIFPNDHMHYIGTLWSGAPKYLIDSIKEADVILVIGTRLSQATTLNYSIINDKSKLIHIDISAAELNKVYPPEIGIVADADAFMTELISDINSRISCDNNDLNKRKAHAKMIGKKHKEYSTPEKRYNKDFVNLEGVMYDLREILPDNTIVTCDAGNYLGWLIKYYLFKESGTCIAPTSGAMGYGLPAAIGAKLASPDSTVISFSGDGGFMMTLQEMETAVRYNIPIISIVANNNMYGTIRAHQESRFPGRVVGTQLTNPSFAKFTELLDGHGVKVRSNEEFAPALKKALKSKNPYLIEVAYDPLDIAVDKTIKDIKNI